jgi:alanyl-tRNA synthetase
MTENLYQQDAYLRCFTATVLDCQPGKNGTYLITLDRTAFYPEGGGQPADTGVLGGVQVLDVHEKEGIITHTCAAPLEIGASVEGQINWQRRFDHMQQHSGEHIVSGMICARFHCDNVGFHLGSDVTTIDFNCDMTLEEALEIEAAANRYITEDHPLEVLYPTAEELPGIPYRSKKELTGQVRLTRFPGADLCACCGTHVRSSSQVGLVKLISCQKFRSGVRLELLCGNRAAQYLSALWLQNLQVSQALSAKPTETGAAALRMKEELAASKTRCGELESQLFALRAEEYRDAGNVLLFEPTLSPDSLRRLTVAIGEVCGGRCTVFAGQDGDYKYAMVAAEGDDLRPVCKEMNAALSGRGGGKPNFVQGSVAATAAAILDHFAPQEA